MSQQNNIRIFDSPEQLTAAAAEFIIAAAAEAIDTKGRFVISLSGGHTPERLYALLASPPYHERINWEKTFVFWGDERCVPADDKDNNAHMARRLLLDHINIPSSNIYAVPTELPPAVAADKYEQAIGAFFKSDTPAFDLILLGLGENGHTASLFPGTDVVFEKTRLVKEVYVAEQHMYRITMTAKLINKAENILFLLEGEGKSQILETVLTAEYQPDVYPAQLIKPVNGHLYWFADKKAGMLLDGAAR